MKTANLYTINDIKDAIGYTRQGVALLVRDKKIKPCFRTRRLILFSEKEFLSILERFQKGKYKAFRKWIRSPSANLPLIALPCVLTVGFPFDWWRGTFFGIFLAWAQISRKILSVQYTMKKEKNSSHVQNHSSRVVSAHNDLTTIVNPRENGWAWDFFLNEVINGKWKK